MNHRKLTLLSLLIILSSFLFLNSCAQIPRDEEELTIIVRPFKITLHSGSENNVCVTLLDKDSGPLFGLKIKALSAAPHIATVTPETITDATGKAFFTIHGVSPGTTSIIFSIAGQKAKLRVISLDR
ncbi:MAG: hypothetical protein FJ264_10025 [Planctomycetes bacterium]|nr:hypothetical protein [Planctomycetota bacterium]